MSRAPWPLVDAMDEEDEPAWTCAASKPKTLNEDPFNVYAEELAMEVCHSAAYHIALLVSKLVIR